MRCDWCNAPDQHDTYCSVCHNEIGQMDAWLNRPRIPMGPDTRVTNNPDLLDLGGYVYDPMHGRR